MADPASFTLIGGHPALDFANTAGWHAREDRLEHLEDYGRLITWAGEAGLLDATEGQALVRHAEHHPRLAERARATAIELREAIYQAFTAITQGRTPAPEDLALIHRARNEALGAATLEWGGEPGAGLRWPGDPPDLARPIYPVAIAAGELLETGRFDRLRQCGNHPCGWLFIDTSRAGSRRWCSSADCGNTSRVRRFRARNA